MNIKPKKYNLDPLANFMGDVMDKLKSLTVRKTYPIKVEYRGYLIHLDVDGMTPPGEKFIFGHEDYCGAPDSGDNRCGVGITIEDCIEQINDIEEDLNN